MFLTPRCCLLVQGRPLLASYDRTANRSDGKVVVQLQVGVHSTHSLAPVNVLSFHILYQQICQLGACLSVATFHQLVHDDLFIHAIRCSLILAAHVPAPAVCLTDPLIQDDPSHTHPTHMHPVAQPSFAYDAVVSELWPFSLPYVCSIFAALTFFFIEFILCSLSHCVN